VTPASPRTIRYSNKPETDVSRRFTVLADSPASPSSKRTTAAPRRGARCAFKNASTSRLDTADGSFRTIVKNTFKSNAVANTVFGRARAPTNRRKSSTSGCPSDGASPVDAALVRLGVHSMKQAPHHHKDGAGRHAESPTYSWKFWKCSI
jgi:hypothetical protein